ncbi:helix-turn-helix domain-containing protein [Lentzea sp. JNUCC 0626]|uniref:helix-turn-helix domain-containing protein n=1 Tax=Lentzea sp. JNUCC 0626 TaxID=3367513 RepID=UPI00374969C8
MSADITLSIFLSSKEKPMPKRYSTVRGREFGAGIRRAIARTGMTGLEIANVMSWQEAKISDMVTGKGGVTLTEVAMVLSACRVPGDERDHLLELFPQTDLQGWWQLHGEYSPTRSRTAHTQVEAAESLVGWHTHAIPLLLRTPEYMRALLLASATVPAKELDDRLCALNELQQSLNNGLDCTFYLHELALQFQVGPLEEHLSQLHRLNHLASRQKITIKVVPRAARAHPGLAGPFTLLRFKAATYAPMVWTETENSSLFTEEASSVKGFEAVVRALDAVSLNPHESGELITRLLNEDGVVRCRQTGLTTTFPCHSKALPHSARPTVLPKPDQRRQTE